MTEQEKIEIFANYLPYGVKVAVDTIYVGFTTELVISNHSNSLKNGMNINQAIEYNAKLILHPLSDLTKPIKVDGYNNGKEFVPIVELLKMKYKAYYDRNIDTYYSKISFDNTSAWFQNQANFEVKVLFHTDDIYSYPEHWIIRQLYKWHFDIHGLTSQGLSIDINTLKNNTL